MGWQAGDTLHKGEYRVVRSLNEGRVGISYLAERPGASGLCSRRCEMRAWRNQPPRSGTHSITG